MVDSSAPSPRTPRNWRVFDLSQPLFAAMPRWPGTKPFETAVVAEVATDGLYERQLVLPEHVGTHVDAPAHFSVAGSHVDELPVESLVASARILDATDLCGDNRDFALTAGQLVHLEREQGLAFRPGEIALVRFGWDRFIDDPERYVGPMGGPPRFPGLAPSAGRLLVERGVRGVGVDTLGVEPGIAVDYPFHRITLPAGLFHVEGLVGLGDVPVGDLMLVVAPLPLFRGSGSPARVLALVEA